MTKKALVVDGSYLIFRSYFAFPKLTDANKTPTGAFYGFARSVLRAVQDFDIEYVFIAQDLPHPTWRHEVYPEYKAGRKEAEEDMIAQIPLVYDWSASITPNLFGVKGYEADDVIKTVCDYLEKDQEIECIYVLSSDRDLYQLLSHPRIVFLGSDQSLFKSSNLKEKYGVGVEQWIDYKALVGDSSDNLAGVPGVGPKTASSILSQLGSLGVITDYIKENKITPELEIFLEKESNKKLINKISENLEVLEQTHRLATLQTVPDLDITMEKVNFTKGVEYFEKYGFRSLTTQAKKLQVGNQQTVDNGTDRQTQDSLF
jgi:DNA polymerase I